MPLPVVTVLLPFSPTSVHAPNPAAASRVSLTSLFWAWLLARTLLWTLLATLTQHTPPLDTVEWLCWGREWQLGYYKHPPLAAWVGEIAFYLTRGSFLGVYLVGYLAVAVALACVWTLARRMLPPKPALAAVVCLDGLVFFQQAAAEYNNQVLLIAFWALAVLLFHRAWNQDHWRDWIGLGLALGLALLCKYSTVFLIAPLLTLWVVRNGCRRWTRPASVMLTAGLVFLPHFVWLCQHDFPTLHYALLRTRGESGAFDHRLSAVTFLLGQALRLLPVALILLPLLRFRRPREDGYVFPDAFAKAQAAASCRDRSFLRTAVLGPVVLHLTASLLLGLELRDIWGAPLWTFAGLLVLAWAPLDDRDVAWRRMVWSWGGVTALSFLVVLASHLTSGWRGKPLRVHYPGPELARVVVRRWQERFGTLLPIAAGDWWLAGNVCCHAGHRPTLYGSLEPAAFGRDPAREKGDPHRFASPEPRTAPWTGDADLGRRGGVLLWDADAYGPELPAWLKVRFPSAMQQAVLVLPCAGCSPDVRVGWVLIPPAPMR